MLPPCWPRQRREGMSADHEAQRSLRPTLARASRRIGYLAAAFANSAMMRSTAVSNSLLAGATMPAVVAVLSLHADRIQPPDRPCPVDFETDVAAKLGGLVHVECLPGHVALSRTGSCLFPAIVPRGFRDGRATSPACGSASRYGTHGGLAFLRQATFKHAGLRCRGWRPPPAADPASLLAGHPPRLAYGSSVRSSFP